MSVQRRFGITGWIDPGLVEVTKHEDVVEERVRATGLYSKCTGSCRFYHRSLMTG